MIDQDEKRWRAGYVVAVFGGFLAYCLGPSLLGLKTLLSVNDLTIYYPWVAGHGSDLLGHENCTGDTVDAVMPGIAQIRSQLLAGHLANWQGVVSGGAPLASVPSLGLLDPLSLPYWFLPLWLAPAFVILGQIIVAAGGTFLFLRQFRISRPAATLAGLIFATSGFMVMWSNWPQTRVAALIPALFWATERLVSRRRLKDSALVAVVVASMLLGGFPSVTGYALYMATAYLVVRVVIVHQRELRLALRTVALAAVGAVLGLLLAMVQLLPFLYYYAHSNLAYRSGDAKQGLPLSGLLTLFAPNSYGLCTAGHANHGVFNPVELVAYIGSAAVVLAVAGAAYGFRRGTGGDHRGVRGFLVAASVVIVLLCWVSPQLRSVTAGLPVFSGNFIGRIRSVLGFGLAVLAGIGFDWLINSNGGAASTSRRRERWAWAAAVWVGAILVGLWVLRDAHRAAFSGGYWPALRQALVVPGILLLIAAVAVAVSRARIPQAKTIAFLVIPVLVAAQAAQFFHTVLPGDNPSDFYPDTPTHQFLAAQLGHDRFASSNLTMYPATALYYGLRTPTGHNFVETEWEDLLTAVDPAVMKTPTFSDFATAVTAGNLGNQPILDRMAVKYFVFPPSVVAGQAEPLPPANGTVGAADGVAGCTLASGPIRGVTFGVADQVTASNAARGITLDVTATDGSTTISSGRYMGPSIAAGSHVTVAVAGAESLSSGGPPLRISVTARGAGQPLKLAARDGSMVCAPVLPIADGLRLAFADPGSVVYERLTSLPRIRWAASSLAIPTTAGRVAALKAGLPPGEVLLDSPGPVASGRPATVTVLDDSGDTTSARVTAQGGGYLVVADAIQQPGWAVTVDGRKSSLLPADEAMATVYVPAGVHTVTFSYSAPGQVAGLALSGLGLAALIAVIFSTQIGEATLRSPKLRRRPQPLHHQDRPND